MNRIFSIGLILWWITNSCQGRAQKATPYSFAYDIADPDSGNFQGHNQKKDENGLVSGSYYHLASDGVWHETTFSNKGHGYASSTMKKDSNSPFGISGVSVYHFSGPQAATLNIPIGLPIGLPIGRAANNAFATGNILDSKIKNQSNKEKEPLSQTSNSQNSFPVQGIELEPQITSFYDDSEETIEEFGNGHNFEHEFNSSEMLTFPRSGNVIKEEIFEPSSIHLKEDIPNKLDQAQQSPKIKLVFPISAENAKDSSESTSKSSFEAIANSYSDSLEEEIDYEPSLTLPSSATLEDEPEIESDTSIETYDYFEDTESYLNSNSPIMNLHEVVGDPNSNSRFPASGSQAKRPESFSNLDFEQVGSHEKVPEFDSDYYIIFSDSFEDPESYPNLKLSPPNFNEDEVPDHASSSIFPPPESLPNLFIPMQESNEVKSKLHSVSYSSSSDTVAPSKSSANSNLPYKILNEDLTKALSSSYVFPSDSENEKPDQSNLEYEPEIDLDSHSKNSGLFKDFDSNSNSSIPISNLLEISSANFLPLDRQEEVTISDPYLDSPFDVTKTDSGAYVLPSDNMFQTSLNSNLPVTNLNVVENFTNSHYSDPELYPNLILQQPNNTLEEQLVIVPDLYLTLPNYFEEYSNLTKDTTESLSNSFLTSVSQNGPEDSNLLLPILDSHEDESDFGSPPDLPTGLLDSLENSSGTIISAQLPTTYLLKDEIPSLSSFRPPFVSRESSQEELPDSHLSPLDYLKVATPDRFTGQNSSPNRAVTSNDSKNVSSNETLKLASRKPVFASAITQGLSLEPTSLPQHIAMENQALKGLDSNFTFVFENTRFENDDNPLFTSDSNPITSELGIQAKTKHASQEPSLTFTNKLSDGSITENVINTSPFGFTDSQRNQLEDSLENDTDFLSFLNQQMQTLLTQETLTNSQPTFGEKDNVNPVSAESNGTSEFLVPIESLKSQQIPKTQTTSELLANVTPEITVDIYSSKNNIDEELSMKKDGTHKVTNSTNQVTDNNIDNANSATVQFTESSNRASTVGTNSGGHSSKVNSSSSRIEGSLTNLVKDKNISMPPILLSLQHQESEAFNSTFIKEKDSDTHHENSQQLTPIHPVVETFYDLKSNIDDGVIKINTNEKGKESSLPSRLIDEELDINPDKSDSLKGKIVKNKEQPSPIGEILNKLTNNPIFKLLDQETLPITSVTLSEIPRDISTSSLVLHTSRGRKKDNSIKYIAEELRRHVNPLIVEANFYQIPLVENYTKSDSKPIRQNITPKIRKAKLGSIIRLGQRKPARASLKANESDEENKDNTEASESAEKQFSKVLFASPITRWTEISRGRPVIQSDLKDAKNRARLRPAIPIVKKHLNKWRYVDELRTKKENKSESLAQVENTTNPIIENDTTSIFVGSKQSSNHSLEEPVILATSETVANEPLSLIKSPVIATTGKIAEKKEVKANMQSKRYIQVTRNVATNETSSGDLKNETNMEEPKNENAHEQIAMNTTVSSESIINNLKTKPVDGVGENRFMAFRKKSFNGKTRPTVLMARKTLNGTRLYKLSSKISKKPQPLDHPTNANETLKRKFHQFSDAIYSTDVNENINGKPFRYQIKNKIDSTLSSGVRGESSLKGNPENVVANLQKRPFRYSSRNNVDNETETNSLNAEINYDNKSSTSEAGVKKEFKSEEIVQENDLKLQSRPLRYALGNTLNKTLATNSSSPTQKIELKLNQESESISQTDAPEIKVDKKQMGEIKARNTNETDIKIQPKQLIHTPANLENKKLVGNLSSPSKISKSTELPETKFVPQSTNDLNATIIKIDEEITQNESAFQNVKSGNIRESGAKLESRSLNNKSRNVDNVVPVDSHVPTQASENKEFDMISLTSTLPKIDTISIGMESTTNNGSLLQNEKAVNNISTTIKKSSKPPGQTSVKDKTKSINWTDLLSKSRQPEIQESESLVSHKTINATINGTGLGNETLLDFKEMEIKRVSKSLSDTSGNVQSQTLVNNNSKIDSQKLQQSENLKSESTLLTANANVTEVSVDTESTIDIDASGNVTVADIKETINQKNSELLSDISGNVENKTLATNSSKL